MKKDLWLIWKQPKTRIRYKVGLLKKDGEEYIFSYLIDEVKLAKKEGFDCYPGFEDLNKIYKNKNLFNNILTRLPNKNRPDYLEMMNKYNLSFDSDNFEILTATRGRLLTDNYEFVPVFDKSELEFDLAGTRYSNDLKECKQYLNINDKLYLEKDSNNKFDKYAIRVIYKKDNKNYYIGYVPRFYTKELSELLDKNINYSALIKNLNFTSLIKDEEITAKVKIIFNN